MKIKVLQFIYGELTAADSWFKQYVEPINRMYCERWGYDYILDLPEWMRTDRSGHWLKPERILHNLTDCDYLFYLDADACFYSHDLSIHNEILPLLLQAGEDKIMLFANDLCAECFRWHADGVNAGVVLTKNCEEAKTILNDWILVPDMPEYVHTRWGWLTDQSGFQHHVHPKHQDKIHMEKEYYMIQGRYSYFVRHVYGACQEDRTDVFKAIFDRFQKQP
jgi:hypothetical protein